MSEGDRPGGGPSESDPAADTRAGSGPGAGPASGVGSAPGAESGAADLAGLAAAVRTHTGLTGKRPIGAVGGFVDASDPVGGPGDDAAVVEVSGRFVVACGEAVQPAFVRADPRGAGVAAVLANVNDVAAMGAVPRAVVNTVVGPASVASEALRGMADAAALYGVPVVGGHITEHDGEPALSAFAVGELGGPPDEALSITRTAPGQDLVFACCTDGEMRSDFDFFSSLRRQGPRLADHIRLPAEAAQRGLAAAARDVSMAGAIGSLAMLLEYRRLGAAVDLDRLPAPASVGLDRWLTCFPAYAFWFATDRPDECAELFRSAGLAAAAVGSVTADGVLRLRRGDQTCPVIDLTQEPITGLWPLR